MNKNSVSNISKPVLITAIFFVLISCSFRLNQDNFDKIRTGMTQEEVKEILGSPTESSSITIGGISGTSSKWTGDGVIITIQFLNGKVQAKQFSKSRDE